MKLLVTAMVILVSLNTMAATTLLRTSMFVGFAPPEYRGEFKTEILSNGSVEYTNNKGKVTQVMKLSKSALKNLVAQIAKFEVTQLDGEDAPVCMDAPSTRVVAVKDGQEVEIKTEFGCVPKTMYSAIELVNIIESAGLMATYLK